MCGSFLLFRLEDTHVFAFLFCIVLFFCQPVADIKKKPLSASSLCLLPGQEDEFGLGSQVVMSPTCRALMVPTHTGECVRVCLWGVGPVPRQNRALPGDLALRPADNHGHWGPASGARLPGPGDEGHGEVHLEVRHTFTFICVCVGESDALKNWISLLPLSKGVLATGSWDHQHRWLSVQTMESPTAEPDCPGPCPRGGLRWSLPPVSYC